MERSLAIDRFGGKWSLARRVAVRTTVIVLLTLIVLVGTVTLIAGARERRSTEEAPAGLLLVCRPPININYHHSACA